jgi:hypothetical protein
LDRVTLEVLGLPFAECSVWLNEKRLLQRRCFCKGIGYVGPKYEEILCGRNGVEEAGASLINTVSICFSKDKNLTRTSGSVTNTMGFLPAINSLDVVSPH